MNERIKELQAEINRLEKQMQYERIRELIIQTGDWLENNGQSDRYEREIKFAELIVKECVTVLNNRFMGDLNREDLEVRRCIADIKKHFGVEA